MLKIEMNPDGEKMVIQAAGSMGDIVAELGIVINDIYQGISHNDPKAAEAFKSAMQSITGDDSPAWKEQLYPGGVCIVMHQGGSSRGDGK